jgi:hypothetical protein
LAAAQQRQQSAGHPSGANPCRRGMKARIDAARLVLRIGYTFAMTELHRACFAFRWTLPGCGSTLPRPWEMQPHE